MTDPPDPGQASFLVLMPAVGRGGGIERYGIDLIDSLRSGGHDVTAVSVLDDSDNLAPSTYEKILFSLRSLQAARRGRGAAGPVRVVATHPSLWPVLLLVARVVDATASRDRFLIFHGDDIWSSRWWQRAIWRRLACRLVTVSAFSAGALSAVGRPAVLRPGIRADLYRRLRRIERTGNPEPGGSLRVLSVFRLEAFPEKGGYKLIEAVEGLRRDGLEAQLTVAGRGPVPDRAAGLADEHRAWLSVAASPTDEQLAQLYARANLFALATDFAARPGASHGEGFGIVLAEAAAAGLPVVAPPSGGSHDAFLAGTTGLAPADSDVRALAEVLRWMASHEDERRRMGLAGRRFAEQQFSPGAFRNRVLQQLAGTPPD